MSVNFDDIKKAVERRNEFLAQHPDYQYLQDEIDSALKKAGSNLHNRQTVLQTMLLNTWFKITEVRL